MKKIFKELYHIQKNQDGIALMMVITAIVLLTTIMITFSFDSNVNKIKAYNIEDKGQAKLTAESGLQMAMARLRLYKEAFNYLEKNDAAKSFATPEVINSIWNFPFIYPIPVSKKMNQIQKDAINKFKENTFLQGNLKLTINNISNKINLNLLRVSLLAQAEASQTTQTNDDKDKTAQDENEFGVEAQITRSLKFSIERESLTDDVFQSKYFGLDPTILVNVIKVNISDPDSLQDDGGAGAQFDQIASTPKQAPFSIMSEMYTLPGWDDDLVKLVKGEFTVHGSIMIDLNKITDKMLRLLIPIITDEEVKEFFEYKDEPENPKYFNTKEDFKRYIVEIGNVVSSSEFDERMAKFEKQGLKFGPSPSLFKVIAVGNKGRSTYTITAYVSIPAKPLVVKKENNEANTNTTENENENENENDTTTENNNNNNTNDETKKDEKQKTQLLEPRIIEIFVS
jgi:type II secretory pathway component PulK